MSTHIGKRHSPTRGRDKRRSNRHSVATADSGRARPAARPGREWAISLSIVAVCVLLAIAALWVFDVIDLPGLGRFAALAGKERQQPSAIAGASARGDKPGPDDGIGPSSAASWPASTGARPFDQGRLSSAVQDFLGSTGSPAREGYLIANGDGKVISSSNANSMLEPASTMKTLTALAAASVLDLDSTLKTDTYLLPAAHADSNGKASRTLVLHGGGDMLLSTAANDPGHVNGRAGLLTLAQETAASLKEHGVRSVRLVSDASLFGTVRRPATMDSSYVSIGYFTPTAALAVDEGRQPVPGSDPDSADRSTIPRTMSPDSQAIADFASLLSSQLSSSKIRLANRASGSGGIQVPAASRSEKSAEKTADRAGRVASASLREILELTLRLSDNTLAEEFGRLVALQEHAQNSPEGGTAAVKAVLAKQKVSLAGAHMADCSGLSPGSRLSPTILFHAMRRLRTHADAGVLRGLPVITARNAGYPAGADGRIRLKTGSLDTVTSVNGVVLRSNGGFFYLAAIVNVDEGQRGVRLKGLAAIDKLSGDLVSL